MRTGHAKPAASLFFQTDLSTSSSRHGLPPGKADNQILGVARP